MVKLLGKALGAAVLIVMVLLAILYLRSDLEPEVWTPAPLPELSGEFAPDELLVNPVYVHFEGRIGPEDITRGPDGKYYTGLNDGSIMRFDAVADGVVELVVNTGGRVLGLQFDGNGNLIIADAVKGLLQLSPAGQLVTLVDAVEGRRLRFVDDLDIAGDGTIWFSDASMRFGFTETTKDFIEASATGRLLSYTPATGVTRVHMQDLFFANGVALGPDDAFVLVNETGTGRIHRLWLTGSRTGQQDLFHEGLPGNPDNLSFNGTDTFWVALPSLRDKDVEKSAGNRMLRKLLGGLPLQELPIREAVGFVIGLDTEGQVRHCLLRKADTFHTVTSVNQWDEALFLGSLAMETIAIIDVPGAGKQ